MTVETRLPTSSHRSIRESADTTEIMMQVEEPMSTPTYSGQHDDDGSGVHRRAPARAPAHVVLRLAQLGVYSCAAKGPPLPVTFLDLLRVFGRFVAERRNSSPTRIFKKERRIIGCEGALPPRTLEFWWLLPQLFCFPVAFWKGGGTGAPASANALFFRLAGLEPR